MRESTAKTRWCPKYQGTENGDNRWTVNGLFSREATCLGSDCMWWIDTEFDVEAQEWTGHCALTETNK